MKKPKILYFMQLPPPVHGVSVMNEIVYKNENINKNFEKYLVEIKFSSNFSEIRRYYLKKILKFFAVAIKLIRALKKIRPNIVYFSLMPIGPGFFRDFFYIMIIKFFNRKIIYHLHNIGIYEKSKKPLINRMYKYVFNHSIIIHPSGLLLKKELKNLVSINPKQFIVPNTSIQFCNSNLYYKKNASDLIRILFFSNLLPEKGIMILLEAMKYLSDKCHNIELNVHGCYYRAKEEKKYLRFISENQLTEKILFKGPCYDEEKERVFYESDIFVFPSHFKEECFPLVILEAMQAGLAIVSSSIGAIPEIIEDGIDGILVEPKNYLQLAAKIQLLADNKRLRTQIGSNAKKKYFRHYSINIFEKNLLYVFNNV